MLTSVIVRFLPLLRVGEYEPRQVVRQAMLDGTSPSR